MDVLKAFKAHFRKQSDILFIVMVKIDRLMVRVHDIILDSVSDNAINTVCTFGQNINNAFSLTAGIPAAFNLMRGNSTTP